MAIVTQPNVIEVSDFRGGWSPDGENPTTDYNTLIDVKNLLPDRNTGSLVVRKGFKRIREELAGLSTHHVKNIGKFSTRGETYIIVVLTDGSASANNVRLYAITASDLSVQRMDTAGVTWANPKAEHWGIGIDGVWYGGSQGNAMYSWDPAGPTWDADASGPTTYRTWVNATNDSVTTSTQYAKDYAFDGTERVLYSGDYYEPTRSIRYTNWTSGKHYSKGDKVSLKVVWASTSTYYKSFICIKGHDADATNKPVVGSGSPGTYWQLEKLDNIQNDDGTTTSDWSFVVIAAQTSIATWHQGRLFMRYDGQGDNSRVLYSAPVKPKEGEDIADVVWDPTDFAPGNDLKGTGGGWLPFNNGRHHGGVSALHSYNQYLLVFFPYSVWVLSGTDDTTWTQRRVSTAAGAVSSHCVVELDSLVYFLSHEGLYATDGTVVQPVPGNERVQRWIRTRLNTLLADGLSRPPQMVAFDGRIWISFPSHSSSDTNVTLVYDVASQSFWYLDLPAYALGTYRADGVKYIIFGATPDYSVRDLVYLYDHASAGDQDDTGVDTYAVTDIPWYMVTAWWAFGTRREERRVRRIWLSLKAAAQTITINGRRNWSSTNVTTTTRTSSGSAEFLDGEWLPDCWTMQLKVAGTKATGAIYGIGVDTQPRRVRYHS